MNSIKHKGNSLLQCLVFRLPIYSLAFFGVFAGCWIKTSFDSPTFEQVVFSTFFEPAGLLKSESEIVLVGLKWCVLFPLGSALALIALELMLSVIWQKIEGGRDLATKSLLVAVRNRCRTFFPGFCIVGSVVFFLHQLSFWTFAESLFGKDYLATNYVDPRHITIAQRDPKNLVFIYVESLEVGYRNAELFQRDLLKSLHNLNVKSLAFNDFVQATSTGWTMAAQVATQCGLPLKVIHGTDGKVQGERIKNFLNSAYCLGDILKDAGYYSVFLQGASLSFAGQGLFWRRHGAEEVYGTESLLELGYPAAGWGVTDDSILQHAKKTVDRLHASGKLFNLTVALVDTHHPKGVLSEECKNRGYVDFKDIVECTAQMTSDFVEYLREREYTKDTNIVIIGDHLAKANPLQKLLRRAERRIFNLFVAESLPEKNRDQIVHFDFLPTVLDFIGMPVVGGKLGLGYSAFGVGTPLPEPERLEEMEASLMNQSSTYLKLWN